MRKIYIDMDGTLAKFYENRETCLEDMFCEGFFKNLNAYQNMIDAFEMVYQYLKDVEIYILSACVTDICKKEKREWLKEYMPWLDDDHILLCNVGDNKSAVVGHVDKNCILIDDYSKNTTEWTAAGGLAIKAINEINDTTGTWRGEKMNCFSTPEKNYFYLYDILYNEDAKEMKVS